MTRLIYFLLLFTSLAHNSYAQLPLDEQKYADSLYTLLEKAGSDSIKARTNFFLVYYWLPRDTAKAGEHLRAGRALSRKYPYLEAVSYAHEAYFYYNIDIAMSEAAYLKADSLLSRYTNKEAFLARSNIWFNYAVLQQRKDDDETYTDIVLNKSIPLAIRSGDSAVMGSQYISVGVAFMNIEQYDKAEVYLDYAINVLRRARTQVTRLIVAYNRAGENYMFLKKYDHAKHVLDTVKSLLAPYPESELYTGYYMVEGMYYQQMRLYNLALESYDKGIASAKGLNKSYRIQELLFFKIKTLLAMKKYEQARQILAGLSVDEEAMSLDNNRLTVYEGMAEASAGLGQMPQAYQWQKRYSALSDSLYKSRLSDNIRGLEMKYKNAENQKEIAALKAKNEQAALAAKNNRLVSWLLGSASIFLLIVALLALQYYRNNKSLLAQKELNHLQELKDIEQQQRLQFGQAVLQGEEQERRRLAQDLHDGLGGMLAGVKINLSGQADDSPSPDQKTELHKIISQLDNSVTELRRIAHNMMPVNLLKFGLETALKDLCESLISDSTGISFQAYGIEENIPEQTQINIYRIVQEMLANAVRHAQASNIILQCSQNGGTFFITQEDNGRGFDTGIIDNKKGIGLSNIKNRVGFLKGKMEIESAINEGTTINIELNVE